VYIPYQFMMAMEDDRLRTAAACPSRAAREGTSGQVAVRYRSCPPGRPADGPPGTAGY
jgi:hypothetical protein